MDFTKLGIAPTAARTETTAVVEPKGADGKTVTMSDGNTLSMTVLLPNTPEGQREMRKWGLQSGKALDEEAATAADEATLDAEVDRQIKAEVELATRVIRDWNLVDAGGKAVPCTVENRRAFFGHFTELRNDAITQMSAKVAGLGNAKKA